MMDDITLIVMKDTVLDIDELEQFIHAVRNKTPVVVLIQEQVYGFYGVLYQYLFKQANLAGAFLFRNIEDLLKPKFKEDLQKLIDEKKAIAKAEEICELIKTDDSPESQVSDGFIANYFAGNIPKDLFDKIISNKELLQKLANIYKTLEPPITQEKIIRVINEGRKAISEALNREERKD